MNDDIEKIKQDIIFTHSFFGHDFTFHSTWGLFNPRNIDEGTRMLIENMDIKETDSVLDLGCGFGALGVVSAFRASKGVVHMVDRDFIAVEYAEKNAKLNNLKNCSIYLSNAFSRVPKDKKFNVIASNLPAKTGKEMLSIILHDAHTHLEKGGLLYVVTISGLKEFIKRNFKEVFGNYEKLQQGKTYTVARAVKE